MGVRENNVVRKVHQRLAALEERLAVVEATNPEVLALDRLSAAEGRLSAAEARLMTVGADRARVVVAEPLTAKQREAVVWLAELLAAGPVRSDLVRQGAVEHGLGDWLLGKARSTLRVHLVKRDYQGKTFWALPKRGA